MREMKYVYLTYISYKILLISM